MKALREALGGRRISPRREGGDASPGTTAVSPSIIRASSSASPPPLLDVSVLGQDDLGGHTTILMRAEEIILALVQGKACSPTKAD